MSNKELMPEQKIDIFVANHPYKDNIMIEDPEGITNLLVEYWNQIVEDYENKTIMFALKVQELMRGYPEKTISAIIDKVRNHPDLKNSASKDRIMMGIRLINNRPDLIEFQNKTKEETKEIPFEDKPYRKRDGTIFWEFYFELYKYNILGKQKELEDKGKAELWSVRKLVQEIQKVRQEWSEPNKKVGLQKHALIRELVIMLRELDPQDLIMLKDVIAKEYDNKLIKYKKWRTNEEKPILKETFAEQRASAKKGESKVEIIGPIYGGKDEQTNERKGL